MVSWGWILLVVVIACVAVLVVLWATDRHLQRFESVCTKFLADELAIADGEAEELRAQYAARDAELREANDKVVEQAIEIHRLNELIEGHTQWASTQYLSMMLVENAADSTWLHAEAQQAIRKRIGAHIAGLVDIERGEDDLARRTISYVGTIRLKTILDSLSVVEGIVRASDTSGALDRKED